MKMVRLRALSIYQPWAEMIIRGLKGWETRWWSREPQGVAGEALLIHAAKKRNDALERQIWEDGFNHLPQPPPEPATLARGAVIGVVWVSEVRRLTMADIHEAICYCRGAIGIRCACAHRFPAEVACRGAQGFFFADVPKEYLAGWPACAFKHETPG